MSDLKGQVMSGLKWSVFAKLVTQIFAWVSTFLVIRMLTPSDYGIITVAMVFFTMVELFTVYGLNAVIVKEQKRNSALSSQIFSLSIYLNIVLSSIMFLLAPYISVLYDNVALINVIYLLAVLNPIASLIVVPAAHLQMEMRFKERGLVEMIAGLVGAFLAFIFASLGYGYWSLIYANIGIIICRVAGYNYYAKSSYSFTLNFKGSFKNIKYALNLQMASLVWFIYNKADVAIVGKYLGLERLGVYSIATEISSIPMSKVGSILNEVGFAAFTKTKDNIELGKLYVIKSLRLISVVAFPVFFGISAVSIELVDVVLGENWSDAGPIIMILCMAFPLRMMALIFNNYANALGRSDVSLQNGLIVAVAVISGIFIGVQYSLEGLAVGWVVGFIISFFIVLLRNVIKFKLPYSCFYVFLPSLIVSAVMWIVIMYSIGWFVVTLSLTGTLVIMGIKIMIGVFVALPILGLIYGKEIISLLKSK